MPERTISASALIEAPPHVVYDLIADYRDGHQRIIPKPPFVGLEVEEGGYGEGTAIRVRIRVLGMIQTYRATITEPEPGRSLVETNDTGYVTTFVVEPRHDGKQAHVTISTALGGRSALRAAVERSLLGPMLRSMFVKELALLSAEATTGARRMQGSGDRSAYPPRPTGQDTG